MYITQSPRLLYRRLTPDDFKDLKDMLADPRVMYAWEHTFSDEEVLQWLRRQEEGYRQTGTGYFAALRRDGGGMVGQIGLHAFSHQGAQAFEVCYMLKADCFHQGYALEGAEAMVRYAFSVLKEETVYAQIKTDNLASLKTAERAGFRRGPVFLKHYLGKDMPHYLYQKDQKEGPHGLL